MGNDLVKRLREYRIGCGIHCSHYGSMGPLDECFEAADRIEELERHVELRDWFLIENDLWEKFAKGAEGKRK